jgi:hypothetical protein
MILRGHPPLRFSFACEGFSLSLLIKGPMTNYPQSCRVQLAEARNPEQPVEATPPITALFGNYAR